MRKPQIAIIGAGIAGLATAASLRQAGVPTSIFEQAQDLRALGAGLQLSPNAVRVLRSLGLEPYLRRNAVAVEALSFLRWNDDTPIACMPLGKRGVQAFGAPYYAVHRADLHRALRASLPDGALNLGAVCTGVQEHTGGATVNFSTGPSIEADVVIGADGIHSMIRTCLAADTPQYTGHVMYRGLVDAGQFPLLAKDPQVRLWLGPEKHVVSYPISAGRLLYFGATSAVASWNQPEWSVPSTTEELADSYGGWSDTVQALISAAYEINCWALYDRQYLNRWGRLRTTLVGDAAHSMLPFMRRPRTKPLRMPLCSPHASAGSQTAALVLPCGSTRTSANRASSASILFRALTPISFTWPMAGSNGNATAASA